LDIAALQATLQGFKNGEGNQGSHHKNEMRAEMGE
jgi:hypothetical protein